MLRHTLDGIAAQRCDDRFSSSIVVADNDIERSGETVVRDFATRSGVPVFYCVEPVRDIALARNQALGRALGDYIAFIDDHETPAANWLERLFSACERMKCDGVLGPVVPSFEAEPPDWVLQGRFFDRPCYPTGYKLKWSECRSGNVLFRRNLVACMNGPFRPQFCVAAADTDFFRRLIERGRVFRWCAEAPVYETVPLSFCRRRFLLKRALLCGSNFHEHGAGVFRSVAKSLAAVPIYAMILPLTAVFGEHVFLKYLMKLLEHTGRVLACSGISVVRHRES